MTQSLFRHIPREEWEWFGNAAHFICASDCQFHMATLVGPWDYEPRVVA